MCGFSAVTSMSERSRFSRRRPSFGSMPTTQRSRKESQPSATSRALPRKLWAISGFMTFSSKLPPAPPTPIATSFPRTWAVAIRSASDWVGFTLPGMMELPGSFAGIRISPIPERGPEDSQRMSFAILWSDTATVFRAPWPATRASFEASASNLFGAVTNSQPVSRVSQVAARPPISGWAFRPVPTAVPPSASSRRCGSEASIRAAPWSSWAA